MLWTISSWGEWDTGEQNLATGEKLPGADMAVFITKLGISERIISTFQQTPGQFNSAFSYVQQVIASVELYVFIGKKTEAMKWGFQL